MSRYAEMQRAIEEAHGRVPRRPRLPFWLHAVLAVLGVAVLVAIGLYTMLGG